jgi:hypothetical protein
MVRSSNAQFAVNLCPRKIHVLVKKSTGKLDILPCPTENKIDRTIEFDTTT